MLPEMFRIGSWKVSGYEFFYFLGIVVGSLLILVLSRKEKLDFLEMVNYLIFGILAGLLGSKLSAVVAVFLENPTMTIRHPRLLLSAVRGGGMISGALISGILFGVIYATIFFKQDRWKVFDITVIGMALGHGIGRVGCLCAGCCFGLPTSLPWGVKFPFLGGRPHPFARVFVHPAQVYESILDLANFVILICLWRKRKFPGQIFSFYLINYGLIRFGVEYLRNDGGRGYLIRGGSPLTSLSFPQLLSILLISGGIFMSRARSKTLAHSKSDRV
jgi:phosphatidylglycerol---prolipoprotein diacylglyceryl transferase